MPVWHVSLARISRDETRALQVAEWSRTAVIEAKRIADRILAGMGTSWEVEEFGKIAYHRRRRLNANEIRTLFKVLPTCPVFTHGAASSALPAEAAR